jgi:hypothetical protein
MIIIEVSKAVYNDVPKASSQRPSTLMSQRPYRYVRVIMASGVNFSKLFRVRVRVLRREGVRRVFGVFVYFRGLG